MMGAWFIAVCEAFAGSCINITVIVTIIGAMVACHGMHVGNQQLCHTLIPQPVMNANMCKSC